MDLSHILWRLTLMAIGFLLAIVAGGAVVVLGLDLVTTTERVVADPEVGTVLRFALHVRAGALVAAVWFSVIAPAWLVTAMFGEFAAVRSLVVHVVAGAAVAVGSLLAITPVAPHLAATAVFDLRLAAATGIVLGLVQWLISGHDAGLFVPGAGADLRSPHAAVRKTGLGDDRDRDRGRLNDEETRT